MKNHSGDEVPKKRSSFGYSFIEKLRQKREARHAEEITKLTKAEQDDEAKRAVKLARLDKIVEDSSEKNRNLGLINQKNHLSCDPS